MATSGRTPALPGSLGQRASVGEIDGSPRLVISFEGARPRLPTTLTSAEVSIAYLLLAGATNADIAHARNRSIPTVAKQVSSLFRKLGVQGRSELVARLLGGECSERALESSSGVDAVRGNSE